MRLIDANEAKEKLIDHASYNSGRGFMYLTDVLHKIDECQTLDVQSLVHAHWIDEGPFCSLVKCSQCGNFLDMSGVNVANFCPNCGARMDEEEENDTL